MLDMIDPATGMSLMRWTIRLAIVCVLARFAVRWTRNDPSIPMSVECGLWSFGFILYGCHVLLAFHFVHAWSHEHAWQHTAEATEQLTGINRGEGLWVNYAFTLVWGLDVIRVVAAALRHRPTSRSVDRIVALVVAFICFNATVVFGPPLYRWLLIPFAMATFFAYRRGT